MVNAGASIVNALVNSLNKILLFIPMLLSGLVILLVGILVASVARFLVRKGATLLHADVWLQKAHIEDKQATDAWVNIASQVVFWFILLSFLIPAFNAWQIPTITNVLNQFVLYLPNVFAAVIIGFLGFVFANIAFNVAKDASGSLGKRTAGFLGNVAKYAIMVFAALMALNQLRVSSNLIDIILGGFVAMVALGGGLAIGLGGRDAVRQILQEQLNKRGQVKSPQRDIAYAQELRKKKNQNP